MTTLVTGAGGFVGGHVARLLVARDEPVRGLDIGWAGDEPFERVTASILDAEALERAFAGVTAVIHCAAIAHLWTRQPRDYDIVNVAGTCRVVAAARRAGARVVHISSYTTLIGENPPPVVDETLELVPNALLGPYPRSKRQGELAALAAGAAGVPVTVVLPSAPVGAGDRHATPPTAMIRDLAAGRVPALLDTTLNLVDVEALAAGILAARDRGRPGVRYLLAGEDIRLADLAARIARLSGVPAPRARVPLTLALAVARGEALLARLTGRRPTAPLTGVRLAARPVRHDTARARAELGFDPPPIDAALARALEN